jgi:dTMP kinase
LLTGESQAIHPLTELLLYAADRSQHVRQVIRPALEQGKTVLCDRYQDSTMAYQGYGRGLDRTWIDALGQWATGGLMPRWTLLLDCPVKIGLVRSTARLQRQNSREDRFEKEALAFHEKCRQGFLDLAKKEPARFAVFDATQDPETVHRSILRFLEGKIL